MIGFAPIVLVQQGADGRWLKQAVLAQFLVVQGLFRELPERSH